MNKVFEKYDFPQSRLKKILIPRETHNDTQSQVAFQLKLNFLEQDEKDNTKEK